MSKFAIRLMTLAIFSMALIAAPLLTVRSAVAGGEPRNGTDPQRCGFVPVSIACRQQPAAVRDTMPTDEYGQRI